MSAYLLALQHCTTTRDGHVRAAVTYCNIVQTSFFHTNTIGICICILIYIRDCMHIHMEVTKLRAVEHTTSLRPFRSTIFRPTALELWFHGPLSLGLSSGPAPSATLVDDWRLVSTGYDVTPCSVSVEGGVVNHLSVLSWRKQATLKASRRKLHTSMCRFR